ncbi:MAG: DinB family protein [Chloroflexota bacterium]
MAHPLVTQLWFARSEFRRCLEGVSAEEAVRRFEPMNCISWIVGHLANQEHFLWVMAPQNRFLAPGLYQLVGTGQPASTPPLDEMWAIWHTVTLAADQFLSTLTTEKLGAYMDWEGKPMRESIGTLILRNTYHYWFHTGEAHAVRQMLGHGSLPQFVGDMSTALYRPE